MHSMAWGTNAVLTLYGGDISVKEGVWLPRVTETFKDLFPSGGKVVQPETAAGIYNNRTPSLWAGVSSESPSELSHLAQETPPDTTAVQGAAFSIAQKIQMHVSHASVSIWKFGTFCLKAILLAPSPRVCKLWRETWSFSTAEVEPAKQGYLGCGLLSAL